jgi:hypothetical protein
MAGKNVGILGVFVVQGCQFPVRFLALFAILELGDLTEDGDLFDKVLK